MSPGILRPSLGWKLSIGIVFCHAQIAASSLDPHEGVPVGAIQALSWRLVGPFVGGRSVAVAGVPGEPETFYFGGSDGGIWETTDSGNRWRNISDCCLTTGAIGAIAVAPSNRRVIYAGTGEPFPRGDMATGNGVWKSEDAGRSWKHIGLTETRIISAISISPQDPQHLYVAALGDAFIPNEHRGVYESYDGGKKWQRVLFVDKRSGAVDLAQDPRDPRVLYAATWDVQRRPWYFSSGGPGSRLYRTTDGGAHWSLLSANPGMPGTPLGKICIAIAPTQPRRVYALIEAKKGGLLRSDDAGATWRLVNRSAALVQRAWYFNRVYVDPNNSAKVFVVQREGIMVSEDGGTTFSTVRANYGDNHVLWISPNDTQTWIVGNDGGGTITHNAGRSWSLTNNQPTGSFYHVAVDDQFPFHLYGAQQDNATLSIASRNTWGAQIGTDQWAVVAQWESGYSVPVPGKPWISYSSGASGLIERTDRRSGQHSFFGPWPDASVGRGAFELKHRFQWTFPLVVSRFAPDTLYAGSQYVMRSRDGGQSWQRISDDLTHNDKSKQRPTGGPVALDVTSVEYYGTVFALAESPLCRGLLWAGTDDGKVWITKDDGSHWRDVTPAGLPKWTTISNIDASNTASGTAYLSARRERQGDYAPYLYKTYDFGLSWQRITGGMPIDDSSFVIREDPSHASLLFAGTLRGVHVSFDGGENWQPLQLNLPHVAIHDMAISREANALALATHGRGFWVLDNLQPLREMSAATVDARAFLHTPQTAFLTGGSRDPNAVTNGFGENPPNGARIFYQLSDAASSATVSLDFADGNGRKIAYFSSRASTAAPVSNAIEKHALEMIPSRAGMNEFVWDLRWPVTIAPAGQSCAGPAVVPGAYRVTLRAGDFTSTREFTVAKDPNIEASSTDLQARYDFLQQLSTTLCRLDAADKHIGELRKALTSNDRAGSTRRGQSARTTVLLKKLDSIADALFEPHSESEVEPDADAGVIALSYPARLRSRLEMISGIVDVSFTRPGESAYQLAEELTPQINMLLDALHEIDAMSSQRAAAANSSLDPHFSKAWSALR